MTVMMSAPIDQEDEEVLVPHADLPENNNHQPMEVVAQPETTNTVESQPVPDPPQTRFTWRIDNFTRLNTKKLYSEVFVVGAYKWRVLIFPKGNNVDYLSMYLDVADSTSLPYGWSRYAQFSLAIVNQIHNKFTVRKDTQHQFNARESDWGFTSFMPLGELYDPSRGYLVNDTLIIEAEVLVRKIVDYWNYDSKKETGYVGLKNQGATCYMNSLLQTLYHIPYFRKAVYHMPTTENDMPSGSIPLALQSLFYKLQYSDTSVATKELTKSFGWDTYDSFMQHDVQELNRVLCEKLEDKMKGTVVEGTIQKLFEGHHMNYIECINVDYKSTRKESFYDLQLDVKGCRDVYASFDKYVEVERLEGDNKYHAEQYGLQDAKKGVLFIDFPPVLQLQLKRFEYDFMRDTMVKINDRYEFPSQLDLDRENGKYLSPDADRSVRNLYTLHSVLVHSGGVHGGHYYAFIRPTLSEQWYKFDDERVTKEDNKRALEEQYGGEEELPQTNPGFNNPPFKFTKYSNAYMLVYIRESDKDKIICNVDEKDIAEHLRERLKKEQEEKEHKKKEKAEAHLYTIIKVARDEDIEGQMGKDIYFDLVDHDKVRSFRVQKQTPFNVFKEEVAKEFGIPVQFQRFWLWAKRQNHTYRPNRPLTQIEETQTVGQLREVSNKVHNAELKLFLEVEKGMDLCPIAPPDKTKDDILLFFKLYDPEKEELRYVGRLFVKCTGKPSANSIKMAYKFVEKKVGIIGCPFNGGQHRNMGVERGPKRLMEYGLIEQLEELEWSVEFDGHHKLNELRPSEDPNIGKLKKPLYVSRVAETVSKAVESHLKRKQVALTLGGDHSLALGTVSGTLSVYPDACLIWVDAHADINTPETTKSGNLHGCPVSFLLGIAGKVPGFEWINKILSPDRIVYIGLRDVEASEKKILKQLGIKAFSMHEVDKYGIGKVVEMALDAVNPKRDLPIHLSFDVDALDPTVAPSTGTPVRGGLTFREGHYICEAIHDTGCVVAVDIMEVAIPDPEIFPDIDETQIFATVTVGLSLIRCCFGETLL